MKEYYRTSEVAKLMHVTPATVANWVAEGKITAFSTVGGHFRILRKDLSAFMKQQGMSMPDEEGTPKYKILIAEDHPATMETVKLMLEDIGFDYELETACDCIETGIELMRFKPDLVILDAALPKGCGVDLVRHIREDKELRHIKILAYTGYPGEGSKMLKLGADKLIIKATKDDDINNFQKIVANLLKVKYRQVIPNQK